ncbi:MAG: toprim domain-containing protein [Defluviicoccus sp.]|nr:toprim domain-containing protein [Defluviicoccus sp.]
MSFPDLPAGYDRHRAALDIVDPGACNPSGVALALHSACRQTIAEGVSQREDPAVRLIGLQLAYLLGVDPRKALGRIYGLAARFGVPADDAALVVGEGIETVLSLVTAEPEITAAAALSAGSLGAFAPPPGIARLVIARDNDDEGALAAERLARRCARAGVAATVIVPAANDFNDDLVALGPAALRARFAPLFLPVALTPARRPAHAVPCPVEEERSGGSGKPTGREEGVNARDRESANRAQAARGVRIHAHREQHRADRPPNRSPSAARR